MIKVPPASTATRNAYEAIIDALGSAGAEAGAMFGMPSIKIGGKGFAGLFGDAMVFKLTGDAHSRALALKGAVLFDPSGTGRAMKEWVVVPRAHVKQWASLAEAAVAYVMGGAKPKKAAAKPAAKRPAARAKSRKA